MKQLSSDQIRRMFLKYFEERGHMIEPGASLVPHNDPTLLWINAGVVALKKYFDGTEETLEYYRMSEFYYVTQIDETTWFACGHSYFDRIEEQLVHIEEVLADNPNEE